MDEDVLQEVENFCYPGDMISFQCLSLEQQGKIYQCCVRPVLFTVVKNRNLLLRMRKDCVGWSMVRSG